MHAIPFGAAKTKSNETIAYPTGELNAPAAGIDSDGGGVVCGQEVKKKLVDTGNHIKKRGATERPNE
ncbi:MAG: hypothetical protein ACKVU2_01815 [Saprospiraceae bacterium]